ncbi:Long-chain-fatty-acid--CoA ligase [Cystobacter fuscus DSM 2262]|uniref:Long-chain-fatty-acid--CoA ligase n=1 Tax=Cystobacter fuscus (strain ATCC 25194 / DSM 2262 / NBRC 100088 / M29) TaxID=1242864 RepID=S9NU01_CYSF2|nr:condensation domain-containing protein [Cystobacter fuscus]EPX55610.1 Long-chain-fatty-acid--CoA ligase [Cystobacter fuscus DSM 2262]
MTTVFPMSFAQRRLCFLHGLDPTGFAHSSARCFQVTGPLDVTALRAAVDVLVARHEPLRTVFPLGASQHVTVLAAACGVVLGHQAGRERVLLGLAVANRELPEVERVLGFFVNTVALRIDLSGDPDFRELLGRVADATAAYAHQDLPFEQLVAELAPPRDPVRSPLVQVNFAHHPAGSMGVMALHGCAVREHLLDFATAKFELTLRVEESVDGASVVWAEFDERVFDTGFIDGLLSSYEEVLRTAALEVPVSRLLSARGATERVLTRIFADVLGVETVGPHDDFFRLGGHSLLLVDVAVRVRAELGRDIGLRDLYQTPTVVGAAARLERAGDTR